AGILLAPAFRLLVREPKRGQYDGPNAKSSPAPLGGVVRMLLKKPSFWGLSFGAACSSMMGYGLIFWLPSFFVRSFGTDLPGFFSWLPDFLIPPDPKPQLYASYFYGAILLVGGVLGIWLGGVLADALGRTRKSAYATTPAIAFIVSLPFFLVGVLSQSLLLTFVAFMFLQALSLVWLGPVLSAFQHLVTPNMRATASAIFLFINNLIGIGLGNLAIGALSDGLAARFGDESLRYAIVSGAVFYVAAAALFFLVAPRLDRDWER
ncbi:MAG: MFS transporter, partial [Parvularculaceae bacterium]|nr:MFS transporter [Parvularculaceae bacterium]